MKTFKLNKFNEIFLVVNELKSSSFTIDLNNLNNNDIKKVLCFISGITFFQGRMKKLSKNKFLVSSN